MSAPTHLTIWRNNRVDAEESWEIAKIVDLYFETDLQLVELPLEVKVRHFLTSEDGPTSGVWTDEAAFEALLDAITDRFHEREKATS